MVRVLVDHLGLNKSITNKPVGDIRNEASASFAPGELIRCFRFMTFWPPFLSTQYMQQEKKDYFRKLLLLWWRELSRFQAVLQQFGLRALINMLFDEQRHKLLPETSFHDFAFSPLLLIYLFTFFILWNYTPWMLLLLVRASQPWTRAQKKDLQ